MYRKKEKNNITIDLVKNVQISFTYLYYNFDDSIYEKNTISDELNQEQNVGR